MTDYPRTLEASQIGADVTMVVRSVTPVNRSYRGNSTIVFTQEVCAGAEDYTPAQQIVLNLNAAAAANLSAKLAELSRRMREVE